MDHYHEHPEESLISGAIRRSNLPTEHPASLGSEGYDRLMKAGIKAAEAQSKRIIAALQAAGLGDARI